MAKMQFMVQLLILHVHFWDVSGINFLTNISVTDLNITELVSLTITEQMRICPYVALCNSPNSSAFIPKLSYLKYTPCCQTCSCDNTCVEEGSCCPDFNDEILTKTALATETMKQLYHLDGNKTVAERQKCVKTQHGSILNREGFTMIASCPPTFQHDDVRSKCEAEFDYSRNFDVYDHIPVTETDSGLTFRNRFCELCNKDKDVSGTFWSVWLTCISRRFAFHYYLVTDPNELAETVLLDQNRRCNIIFDFEYWMTGGLNSTPQYCETEDTIGSCDEKYSNTVLETLCSKYFWPIKRINSREASIYKNYACMLCNGVKFTEKCSPAYVGHDKHFVFSLTTSFGKTKQIPSTNLNRTTQNKDNRDQVIERYFPNDAGEVYCQKGFVYDSKKDLCRQVLCPLYFYVKDGVCIPMLSVVKGIVYQVLLQADVPFILQEDEEKVVGAIAVSLDAIFRGRLGEGNYDFDIWKANTTLQLRLNRQYLIILAISGNVGQGRYISMLKFINNFVLLEKQLSISTNNYRNDDPSNVFIRFNTSTDLLTSWKPFNQYTNNFQLTKSHNRTRNLKIRDNGSIFYISPTVLCYRVALSENEVKSNALKPRFISIARMELVMPNFERIYHNDEPLLMVCLDHAFNNIPETVSYIFLNNNETNYKFISKPKVNSKKNVDGKTGIKTGTEEEKISIVPTLATIGVVVFVIMIRQTLKRLTTRESNIGSTEETVINMTVIDRVSRDEESNISENGGNISVGNKEELLEPIQAARNDKDIINDSEQRPHTSRNEDDSCRRE